MPPTNLHCDNDELGHDRELAAEAGVEARVPEGEADSAVGGNDLEEDGKGSECLWVLVTVRGSEKRGLT